MCLFKLNYLTGDIWMCGGGKGVRVGPIHALKNLKAVFLNQMSFDYLYDIYNACPLVLIKHELKSKQLRMKRM